MPQAPMAKLIDLMYEAAIFPNNWPDVLESLASSTGFFGGVLFTDGPGGIRWTADRFMWPVMDAFVSNGWNCNNSRVAGRLRCDRAGFLDENDLYTNGAFETEPMYVGHFRPLGLGWSASTLIHGRDDRLVVMSLERRFDLGPASRDTLDKLDALRPHLARATMFAACAGTDRGRVGVGVLAELGLPAVLVRRDGRVLAVNSLFERLQVRISIMARDRLRFDDQETHSAFMKSLSGQPTPGRTLGSFAVAGRMNAAPAVAHVLPLRKDAHDLFGGDAIIYFVSPGRRTPPHVSILRGLFDLSPREAATVRDLLVGFSASTVARRRGVSRETVRTQIRSALGKAGVRRQGELVAVLAPLMSSEEPNECD
jgi:DNA-binding CsgD family transcriptional regulator